MSNYYSEKERESREAQPFAYLGSNDLMSVKSKWVNVQNARKNLQSDSAFVYASYLALFLLIIVFTVLWDTT